MLRPKQRPLDADRIDKELNSPESKKIREDLSKLVRELDNEIEEGSKPEESYIPQGLKKEDRRGPLSNQDRAKRIAAAQVPPPRQQVSNKPRQSFNLNQEVEEPITNRIRSGPISPPLIPEMDLLRKQIKDLESKIEVLGKSNSQPVETKTPKPPLQLAARRISYNPKYQAIVPPSKGAFYNFPIEDLRVKKIDIDIQRAITSAKQSRDTSALIDAVGATLQEPIDIRDLTNEDWFFVLYFHLFTSYSKSSFTLNWTSKYGNENTYRITESDIIYLNPGITREQYFEDFLSKGVCVPTLREWELLNTDILSVEDADIVLRAQYYTGNTIEEKVDNYLKYGETLDYSYLVEELKQRCQHGISNSVNVIDAKFNQEVFIKQRKSYLEGIKQEAKSYKNNQTLYSIYLAEIEEVTKEITDLETKIKKGEQVRPEVETKPVRFNALDIFPVL